MPAGYTAVAIGLINALPAFSGLRKDIGRAALCLGIKGVKSLLKPFLGRFTRIDRAALTDRLRGFVTLTELVAILL